MSADFWAGYISGAIGILVGNPLDLIKVRLQASSDTASSRPATSYVRHFQNRTSLITGTAAPVLGYGALNALLFVSYNRTNEIFNSWLHTSSSLWATWAAGAVGGLATWVVSTPTELIKCRAQVASTPSSSWDITKQVWRSDGLRGLYFGGGVTALRDSVGYGFYFWSYELSSSWFGNGTADGATRWTQDAVKVLLCGGLAGVVTWVSVFPLDVIKTRVQTQVAQPAMAPLLGGPASTCARLGAVDIARQAYAEAGWRVFFRGLTVCSVRAFVVNAVQWAVYEWVMVELGQAKHKPEEAPSDA
ncbi:mitochondrial carrier domain-containing protein [Microdochium trichocladiopsis]|uniref:Mitochondrial carrier domain-containing protein n=1 Tax=Microdochium trichocladiopsis TaxID=1682393 RepID=A0A9P9BM88_9PEZI|nr:mitochondrial carrier domain-containing protein [Microdochium trichocladiopsis]KAH7029348.1 mitochondrial carrier domain-containing protein [Microdochium trichocladiopsis]